MLLYPVSSVQSNDGQTYLRLLDTMGPGILSILKLTCSDPMAIFSSITNYIFTFLSFILPFNCLKNIEILIKILPRDIRTVYAALQILYASYYIKIFNSTVISEFQKLVKKNPEKICFYYQDEQWSLKQIDDFSNKIAQVFHNAGYKKGDTVALFMTNRAEYACIWLGLGKIGVVTALINTNLRLKSLSYCIGVGNTKAIIFSNDLAAAIDSIRQSLDSTIRLFQFGGSPKQGICSLDNALKFAKPVVSTKVELNKNDHFLYIYTSGTTGLPKAAIIPHFRFLLLMVFGKHLLGLRSDDVVYDPLPLYHTAGGLLGIGSGITIGGSVVIRQKFSASSYILDCIKYKCTVGQYIGEICRYILSVPPKPSDTKHSLRFIVGNGLRTSIWTQFVTRFNVPNVMEIYGSTEGNLLIANIDNTIGAVGSLPRFFPLKKYVGSIIKVNSETMEPIRDPNGFCIECKINEPGMFIGVIPSKGSLKEVYGYLDKKESDKKIISNVFKKGDRAFVSGDILQMDEYGYLYFKDRTGDTFRWKGENVSTSEVESIISSAVEYRDCVVYGVQVGDLEGRAGMLAIVDPGNDLDLDKFAKALDSTLPKYQHPVFIRSLPEIEKTGTFKLKKVKLQSEGFDPSKIKDIIHFKSGPGYIRLTKELYDGIAKGLVAV